jgi:outer membrane receptor protein involved in Fe transport
MKKYLSLTERFLAFVSLMIGVLFLFLEPSIAASEDLQYQITAKKLDDSRNKLSPQIGASSYSFNKEDIENLPQGQMTPLNQVLLRSPSVAQNSYGQLHVRGDHGNLQYRINGVMLPAGIASFGQTLDTHFADKIDFMTGTLPAQYGYNTAGVVDIKTKSGAFANGGYSEVMVGGNNTVGLNQQISGSKDNLNYYLSATYLQNNRGIESPTAAKNPIHDNTNQDKVFGYFSYLIDAVTRFSVIVGNADNNFQVPNNPNQPSNYTLNGFDGFNSSNLNEKQSESSKYAIASLQGISDSEVGYQVSAFTKYSDLKFRSDYVGDLIFNGIASDIDRSSFTNGLQGDFNYDLNESNTLRSGFFFSDDAVKSGSNSAVFAVDADGNQTSSDPFRISNDSVKHSQLYGLYLQNEWKALEKLTINYGVRFDASASYAHESQISPRFGGVYDLSKKTKIHAGFSRYFTPPPTSLISSTTLSNFQNTTNASENLTNDKVRAERTNYYDIGVTHKVTPNLNVAFDAYYKQIKNLLDEGQFGNALIYTPFNYQRGKVYGAEFTADYHKDNFSSYFNLATLKAYGKNVISGQYLLGNDELNYISKNYVNLDHAQTYTVSAGVSYTFYKTKYSADAIYGSGLRTGDNNLNTMPSYLQTNLSVSKDFTAYGIGKFNTRVAVINLLDKNYQLHDGSGIGVAASQYGPRRTLYLTVSKSF